jgi:hypothetical protein
VKLPADQKLPDSVRSAFAYAGPQAPQVLINSGNEIQVYAFSDHFTKASLDFQTSIAGFGIIFAKLSGDHLYAVSQSGHKLSKWTISSKSASPIEREFDSPVSSIHVDSENVVAGHPKCLVDLLRADDLTTISTYTCAKDSTGSIQSAERSKAKSRRDLFQSLQGLVLHVEKVGNFIVGSTDSSTSTHFFLNIPLVAYRLIAGVCIWSISLKNFAQPIKSRDVSGKLVSKLHVDSSNPEKLYLSGAVSRSHSEDGAKVSPKDIRIDIFTWSIPKNSVENAEKRALRDSTYQSSLSTLLSRDISKSLLLDVGFAHRMLKTMSSSTVDGDLVPSLVNISSSLKRLPVYLTAAVDENFTLVEGWRQNLEMLFQAGGSPMQVSASVCFLDPFSF